MTTPAIRSDVARALLHTYSKLDDLHAMIKGDFAPNGVFEMRAWEAAMRAFAQKIEDIRWIIESHREVSEQSFAHLIEDLSAPR